MHPYVTPPHTQPSHQHTSQVVHAQMALWVSGVVLFTLTVNAAALGPLMVALGLNKTTPLQRKMHRCVFVGVGWLVGWHR